MWTGPRRSVLIAVAVAAGGAVFLSGCGSAAPARQPVQAPATPGARQTEANPPGDIPDQQVFVPFTPPGSHITVKVPEGWAQTRTADGVTFTDKLNSITIREAAAAKASTAASVAAGVVPRIAAQVPAYSAGRVTTVKRAAGTAVVVTYQGDSAPDPVTNKVVRDAFERYSFWKGGREAVVTLSGPTGADNVDPWRIVTDSLRWR